MDKLSYSSPFFESMDTTLLEFWIVFIYHAKPICSNPICIFEMLASSVTNIAPLEGSLAPSSSSSFYLRLFSSLKRHLAPHPNLVEIFLY